MRNRRKLGLIALAVLALSGLWAASASAYTQQKVFQASSYPAKITGTQVGESTLTTVKGTISCNTSLSGQINGSTSVASLALSGYCESFGVKNSFKTNGCNVELTPGWNALGFGPSGCGPITLQVSTCTISIPAQDGLFATYENSGGGVRVTLNTSRLRYSGACAADNEGGKFTATWQLSGVSMSAPGESTVFAAEKYPANLVGTAEAGAPHVINTEGGKIECKNTSFSGSLASAAKAVTLTPSYSDCNAFGFTSSVVVAPNGCTYTYSLGESENHSMAINCPVGSSITVAAGPCSVSIPAQSGLKTITYNNLDATPTSRSAIEILSNVSGLTYTVTNDGFGCPFGGTGTRKTGTITGTTLLEGRNVAGRPANIKIGA